MSTITRPTAFDPRAVRPWVQTTQRLRGSPFGGSQQVTDLLNDVWMMDVELPESDTADGQAIESFINALRGQVNVVSLYHFGRPAPLGTMRGTLTISGAVSQGASSITVTGGAGQASKTLLAGDLLGVGGLLLEVAANATANGSGVITVTLNTRVRTALSNGAAVTWDKPSALFRMIDTTRVQYTRARASGVSMQFMEAVS